MLREWKDWPKYMQTKEVRSCYDSLKKKRISLVLKRIFGFCVAALMSIILSPVLIGFPIVIIVDSKGAVF